MGAQENAHLHASALPAGYRLDVATSLAITTVRIVTGDGAVAASGYAVQYSSVFVFDRIVTEAAHRRRVLVATEDGLTLYASLGWHIQSPYSTAAIT
ncbi:hypothetical protein [Janthinobacterium sp. LB3P118]|uniref:hypothetical protein n=1 Tax=Janthinobacterium sp. LB3P118 TaxID=3424195 RepID=UPI003F283FDA